VQEADPPKYLPACTSSIARSMAQPSETAVAVDALTDASAAAIQRECLPHRLEPSDPHVHRRTPNTGCAEDCEAAGGPVQLADVDASSVPDNSSSATPPVDARLLNLPQGAAQQAAECPARQNHQATSNAEATNSTSEACLFERTSCIASDRSKAQPGLPILRLPDNLAACTASLGTPTVATGIQTQARPPCPQNGYGSCNTGGCNPTRRHSTGTSLRNSVASKGPLGLPNPQDTELDKADVVPTPYHSMRRHSIASFVTSRKSAGGEQLKQLPIMEATMPSGQLHRTCTADIEVRRSHLRKACTLGQVRSLCPHKGDCAQDVSSGTTISAFVFFSGGGCPVLNLKTLSASLIRKRGPHADRWHHHLCS
jgi:hypothetical protein